MHVRAYPRCEVRPPEGLLLQPHSGAACHWAAHLAETAQVGLEAPFPGDKCPAPIVLLQLAEEVGP